MLKLMKKKELKMQEMKMKQGNIMTKLGLANEKYEETQEHACIICHLGEDK
jgi:hypothetical protein